MTLVTVDDSLISTIGTELSAVLDGVQKIVADEANPLQAADLTPITDPIAKIQAALAAPAATAPVDSGDGSTTTPPVDTTPPADSGDTPVASTPVDGGATDGGTEAS
jgi:hypothetical protein